MHPITRLGLPSIFLAASLVLAANAQETPTNPGQTPSPAAKEPQQKKSDHDQTPASGSKQPQNPDSDIVQPQSTHEEEQSADESLPVLIPSLKDNVEEATKLAWKMLEAAAAGSKPQSRIDALSALGTLGCYPPAEDLLRSGLKDSDRDVRVAAVFALGATQNRALIPALRTALDDSAPEVSFAAAVTLWREGDRTGENVLYGVLDGERKAAPGAITKELHQVNKDLHNPATLALLGAQQGAYALLGPFGIGLDALRLMRKDSNTNSARVLATDLVAEDHGAITRQKLIDALGDKDAFVRAASARALGSFPGKDTSDALLAAFDDPKHTVRTMAAASYIRVTHPLRAPAHGRRPCRVKAVHRP